MVPDITVPVPDRELSPYRHKILVNDLPGLNPYLYRALGLLIAANIGKVAVKLFSGRY